MKLFSRRVVMRGAPSELLDYHTKMQAFVSDVVDREVAVWSMSLGAPVGTVTYSIRVEGLADLAESTAKLVTHPDYAEHVAWALERQVVPSEDSVGTIIHGELSGDPPPVGAAAIITQAQIAGGAYEAGIGWGVEMAQHAESVTGLPVLFGLSDAGALGSVTWIGVAADLGAAEEGMDKLNADADYVKRQAEAGELFVEGSGHRLFATRFA